MHLFQFYMDLGFYGQFPKSLWTLVDDVEDSESLAHDDNASRKEDAMSMAPQSGLRPLNKNSQGKYLSRALRLSYNSLPNLICLDNVVSHFLAEPSKLGWLDLSFNKLKLINPVLCELSELRVLYLHSNAIWRLSEVDQLGKLQYLHTITLHGNNIETHKGYRRHVISALPQLKKMDFSIVTPDERVLANIQRRCNNRGKNTEESLQ